MGSLHLNLSISASISKLGFRASTYQLEEIRSVPNSVCVCLSTSFLALHAWLISILFPAQVSNHFSKEPCFTSLENDINQDLGSRCAYCYWSTIASRPSQQKEQENMCMYTNSHVDKYPKILPVYPSVTV